MALLATHILVGGCSYALHPSIVLAGRRFPTERVAELREGQTMDEVRAILGEPFEAQADGPAARWRYLEKVRPRGCTTRLLGLITAGQPRDAVYTVDVRIAFRNDAAQNIDVRRGYDHGARQ